MLITFLIRTLSQNSRFLGRNKSGRQLLLSSDLDDDTSVTFDRRKGGVREPLMMA